MEMAARGRGKRTKSGPRFDLKFEAGRGILRLAQPLPTALGRIDALELSLGAVRFPVDVTEGPQRFRTRRTLVRSARASVDPAALSRAAAEAGFTLTLAGEASRGRFHACICDELGVIAFEATVAVDGPDVWLVLDGVRAASDGPVTPWARLDRVAGRLGVRFDAARGAYLLARPMRRILTQGLVTRGWRLPDERSADLSSLLLRDGEIVLTLGPVLPRQASGGRGDHDGRPSAIALDLARLLGPIVGRLVEADVMGASDLLGAVRRRLEERPGAEPELLEGVERLACAIAIERADDADAAPRALRAAEGSDDPAMLAVGLRAAVRLSDHSLAEAIAERIAAVDPVPELVADALVAAAELVREVAPDRARALLRRALGRRPTDAALLLRCIDLAELSGETAHLEELARRALSSPIPSAERARLAAAAAQAIERAGGGSGSPRAREVADELWQDALAASPDDPDALSGIGASLARRGDREAAIARFDRAADGYAAQHRRAAAARTLARSAELSASAGRLAAAEQRLERAVQLGDAEPALYCALARVRVRLGALTAAASAYASLLGIGARAGATLAPALVEAASFQLDELRDPEGAEPFVAALARLRTDDPRARALRERIESGRRSSERGPRLTTGGTADIESLTDAVERHHDPGERRDDAVRAALDVARDSADPSAAGRLAERLAQIDRLPSDVLLLEALERLAIDPRPRAAIARAASHALRAMGHAGDAALALARAGMALRDAATLRAAIELAEDSEAWPEAYEAVAIALDVVGEGPARAALLARQDRIAERL